MQLDSVDTSHLVHDDSDWTNTLRLIHGYQDDFSEDIIRQARLYIKKRATPTWKTRQQSACSLMFIWHSRLTAAEAGIDFLALDVSLQYYHRRLNRLPVPPPPMGGIRVKDGPR